MLQFHRESVRAPHLVVLEGGGSDAGRRRGDARRWARALWRFPVALVLIATLVAVAVDIVDSVPAWSPWAAVGTALVLTMHAVVTRLRSR